MSGSIISATSTQAGGGDVNITAEDIRLRNGSLISTSVFNSTGGGGNITINSPVFLALEDSDILANASAGPGGDITINSQAFLRELFDGGRATAVGRNPGNFGRFRSNNRVDISVSRNPRNSVVVVDRNSDVFIQNNAAPLRGNNRVDISADSQTGSDGNVDLPNPDPSLGVTPLPADLIDPGDQLDRSCPTLRDSQARSSFTVTGRGGLPSSPSEALDNHGIVSTWINDDSAEQQQASTQKIPIPQSSVPNPQSPILEAQGWVVNEKRQVILTAQAPTVTLQGEWPRSAECKTLQNASAPRS